MASEPGTQHLTEPDPEGLELRTHTDDQTASEQVRETSDSVQGEDHPDTTKVRDLLITYMANAKSYCAKGNVMTL